ncbi:hypothetical protein [Lacimicrobium sp. SS2-24]|uniref:hypothetical protein n=1 Tax=Lacimicrobium sp. SS2-24 TaxID=2005569 RepID=UPI000B4B4DFB|nr:hypothetical protein [Lacimicrobium sp. SS2-24]
MNPQTHSSQLPTALRIILGLASIPSLILGYMLLNTAVEQGFSGIGAMEVVYAAGGLIAAILAITGKRPF